MARKPNPEQVQIDALRKKLERHRRELHELQTGDTPPPWKRQQILRDEIYAIKRRIDQLEQAPQRN